MRKGKSSMVDHRFPNFYACYLLRSVKTPRSQSTYIGSTPNPPRRLRQHNGDLTAGAWKTSRHRPWVMQLIVYGFPSKLAALQFEWAWQHPGISRHVRGGEGIKALCQTTRTRYLKANIQILRLMLSMSPYNMWPLHVKIFTEEALKIWNDVEKAVSQSAYLPLGFTYSIELEGVDGKSGKKGSGRTNAIEVNDEVFTAAYLKKHTSLLSRSPQKPCSICKEPLDISSEDSLAISLCPHSNCEAVSHISCLAREFLIRSGPSSQDSAVIPRGGSCGSCNQYTLWGDIIRGCHRRRPLHVDTQLDDDGGVEEDSENGEIFTGEESDSASYVEGLLPLPDGAKTCGIKSATTIKKVAQIPAKLSTARNKLNPEPLSEHITKTAKKPAKISTRQPSTKESDSSTALGIPPRRRTKKIVTGSKSLHTSSVHDSREFLDLDIVSSHRHSEPLSPARFHNDRYTNQVLGHQGWTAPTPERRSPARHRSMSREAFDLERPFILEFKEDEKSNRSSSIDSVELEQEFRRGVNIPKGTIVPSACQSPKGATSVVIPSCISSSPLEYEMSVLSISSPTHSPRLSQYSLRSGTIGDNCDVIVLSD